MNDMLGTIIPKSDQLNADDLLGGRTITITVTGVDITMNEQPVAIHFEGDEGKPYRPGKSMRRVLVNVWGPDANAYVGRSMTLYRDDTVKFGGLDVGGIRISHMSHMKGAITMALTATRAIRKPFTVKPLAAPVKAKLPDKTSNDASRRDEINDAVPLSSNPAEPQAETEQKPPDIWTTFRAKVKKALDAAMTTDEVHAVASRKTVTDALLAAPSPHRDGMQDDIATAYARVRPAPENTSTPGDAVDELMDAGKFPA